MAAPDLRLTALVLTFLVGFAGCRGTPQPVVRADEPAAQKASASEAPPQTPTPPSTTSAAPAAPPQGNKTVRDGDPVVVDPGIPDDELHMTLAQAAKTERERRAQSDKSKTVINDKTLPKLASKGQITLADVKESKKKAAGAAPAPGRPVDPRDEQYWRGRGLEIRERWRQAAEDVKELEQRTMELRQKFYMEDDVFVRDNHVKPEWDRALDRLRETKLAVEAARKELEAFLEEGREAGALAGWLREGEEKEPEVQAGKKPEPSDPNALPEHQSIEPPVLPNADVPPPGDRG